MKKYFFGILAIIAVSSFSQDVLFINDDYSAFYFSPTETSETDNIQISSTTQASNSKEFSTNDGYWGFQNGVSYRINDRLTTGFSVLHDRSFGVVFQNDFKGNIAYKLRIGDEFSLTAGLNLGIGTERYDCSNLIFPQTPNDPVCDPSVGMLADIGFSLKWKQLKLTYGGLNNDFSLSNDYERFTFHNLKASYEFNFGIGAKNLAITPFLRYVSQSGFNDMYIGSNFKFQKLKLMAASNINFWFASIGYESEKWGLGFLYGENTNLRSTWPLQELRFTIKL